MLLPIRQSINAAPCFGMSETFWYGPSGMIAGNMSISTEVALADIERVTTNCFARVGANVIGFTLMTPSMVKTSPYERFCASPETVSVDPAFDAATTGPVGFAMASTIAVGAATTAAAAEIKNPRNPRRVLSISSL